MDILNTVERAAVGAGWKLAAIGLLAALVATSSYMGYQWHAAASARDTAVAERKTAETARDKAVGDNGELRAHIGNQNTSIVAMEKESDLAKLQYSAAIKAMAPMQASIAALAAKISGIPPSVTCSQALARQRQVVEELRAVPR